MDLLWTLAILLLLVALAIWLGGMTLALAAILAGGIAEGIVLRVLCGRRRIG